MFEKPAAALLALALAVALGACEKDRARILEPSGTPPGNATLSGTLDFGDGSFPRALVLAARVATCASDFSTIQIVGSNTNPIFNFAISPHLTQLAPCSWIDTLTIPSGTFEWKFGTNGNFDENPDYGRPGSQIDGLEGTAIKGSPGPDGNLQANVSATDAGLVVCQLDETRQPAPYSFKAVGAPGSRAAFSSTVNGAFAIAGLQPGSYNVVIRAPGKPPRTLTGVVVTSSGADLGTITIGGTGFSGGVRDTVVFDPKNFPDLTDAPWPPITVTVFQGGVPVDTVVTDRSSNVFQVTGLAPGTYQVVVDARLFGAVTREVTVASSVVDLAFGSITLPYESTELPSQMNIAGDWNNFVLDASNEMNQSALGVWFYETQDPIPAPDQVANPQFFKFVTDGSFDNPTDYGGDESVTLNAPISNQPVRLVSGLGTALKIQFPSSARYRFTLDERRQVFSIQELPPATLTAARRTR